jgi:hypothetical protein
MSLFLVATRAEGFDAVIEQAIRSTYPDKYLALGRGQWVVVGEGTAKNVSDAIGITDTPQSPGIVPHVGGTIVFAFTGYYGRSPSNIWEWMASKVK